MECAISLPSSEAVQSGVGGSPRVGSLQPSHYDGSLEEGCCFLLPPPFDADIRVQGRRAVNISSPPPPRSVPSSAVDPVGDRRLPLLSRDLTTPPLTITGVAQSPFVPEQFTAWPADIHG